MKLTTLLLTFLFIPGYFSAFAQWQVVHSGGSQNLAGGCFISDSVGFVISSNGIILKSDDQGATWSEKATLQGIFTSICKVGPDTLYAGGNCIYMSSDRGTTWNLVTTLGYTTTQLGFFGPQTGFSIVPNITHCVWAGNDYYVDSYYIAKSTDYGVSWQPELGIGERTNRIQFINDSVAYFNGGAYVGYPHCFDGWYDVSKRTTTRGITWSPVSQPPPGRTYYSFFNSDSGYFIRPGLSYLPDDKYKIWKTEDGGSTFSQSYTEIMDPTVKQTVFIKETDGYLLGNNNIYVTRSNGLSWNNDYSSVQQLNFLFYNTSHYLFGLGSNGLILKKLIIESTHSDTIYRVKTDSNTMNFGLLPLNTSAIKQLTVTNTGNVDLALTMASSAPFRLSLNGSSFGTSISIPAIPFQATTVFIQFAPLLASSYRDTLFITADSLETIRIPVSGSGFRGLAGIITHDTLICTDTLSVIGNVTVNEGARMTICPGTYVRFMGKYSFNIEGVLDARGDSIENIRFGVQTVNSKWDGIKINNPDYADQSFFSWCTFPVRCDSAAIHIINGNVIMDHCAVSNPSGTGIRVSGSHSKLVLENSSVFNTTGAIMGGGNMRIRQNEIFSNQEGIRFSGANILIENNEIHHHYLQGISCDSFDSSIIVRNKIFNNYNCGIHFSGSYVLIENNEIYNNTARGIYGEIGAKGCYIIQNLVFNNQTIVWLGQGGGIYLTPNSPAGSKAILIGNTICNNRDYSHISELAVAGRPSHELDLQIINNIFYNSGSEMGMVAWWDVTSSIGFNCINQIALPGPTNINAVAGFVNPTTNIGVLTDIGNYDWSLQPTSPCINKGDTVTTAYELPFDFAGNPRVCGNRIDMGAYEYQGPFSIPETDLSSEAVVFPNPTGGILNVSLKRHTPVEMSFFDISGRKLMQQTVIRTSTIDLQSLNQGIFMYEIRDNRGVIGRGKIIRK